MFSRFLHPVLALSMLLCIGVSCGAAAATKHSTHHTKSSHVHKKPGGPALVIRGDLVTSRGLVDAIANAYEDSGKGRIDVQPFNTISGIDAALNGSADIAATARAGFSGRAQEAGLTFTPVAWDALVIIASPDNPVSNITLKQLRDVYYGDITNWSQLGGKDEPIDLYTVASPLDGAEYSLRKLLYGSGDARVASPRWYINVDALEQGVALDPKAFGLSTLSGVHDNKGVKVIPIEGVTPTPTTVADGSYPLYTAIYLASNPSSPHAAEIAKFMDFLKTDEARKIAREHDLVPYSDAPTLDAQSADQQIAAVNAKMVSEGLPPSAAPAVASTAMPAPTPQLAAHGAVKAAQLAQQASNIAQTAPSPNEKQQAAVVAQQAAHEAQTAALQAQASSNDSRHAQHAVNKAQQAATAATRAATQAQQTAAVTPSASAPTGNATGDVLAAAPANASTAAVVASADQTGANAGGNPALKKAETTAPSNPVLISANGTVTPVTPPPAAANAGGSYTVSKGDTLSSIARKKSVSVSDLRKWNELKGDTLRVGQVLKLSGSQ